MVKAFWNRGTYASAPDNEDNKMPRTEMLCVPDPAEEVLMVVDKL
jgi:hypothetical protein